MLDQVKDHLEFLSVQSHMPIGEIEDVDVDADFPHPVRIHIPKMKNLKEFRNQMLDLFDCGEDICIGRITTLQTLHVATVKSNLDHFLRNIEQKKDLFRGVKKLHVRDVVNPESITGLKVAFPNLESLSIVQFNVDGLMSTKAANVGRCVRPCNSLGLKYLELISIHWQRLGGFMQGFANCEELLASLKSLKIRFVISPRVKDDLDMTEQMKQWLLGMKSLENVYIAGLRLKDETWDWVETFIQENKLPIVFEEGEDEIFS
ncbi:uncharacterized protein LOC118433328 isoform X1 [Folsomia candida]|uniref:uncharacterized protein LOC118433328 isoform X1 n=2 Tax=Folsomia candida TaxID=158441 RepID=UPI00160507E0|nr:uncharacterized protein LOC118433328 isoform X1 [Folsomia candida]